MIGNLQEFFEVDFNFANCLYCVGMHYDTASFYDLGNIIYREDNAGLTVSIHYGNKGGIWTQSITKFVKVELTFFVYAEVGYFVTTLFKVAAYIKNSRVFDTGSDNVFLSGCASRAE